MSDNYTVARPYAKAAFGLASDAKALDAWSSMLSGASLMVQDEEFLRLIKTPTFSHQEAVVWMTDILKDTVDEKGCLFLGLLAQNQRLIFLPQIAELFEFYAMEARKLLQAHVFSAQPLTSQFKEQIQNMLKKRLGVEQVELVCELDESLLAGAVIKANDLVIDGSAKGRLSRLAQALGV